METVRFTSMILLLFVCTAFCFPSRPLNERSPELAWQAWLLVDDQNQNKQHDADGMLRRRITPKSVFIAPTFSPESLPPCADGYRSDPMGRCIKIIKLDEDAHLEFLLQKLNEKFGDADYDYEEQEEATPGPFQVNIPLGGEEESNEPSAEETDIAIVVAPTNSNFEVSFKLDKRDNKVAGTDEVTSTVKVDTTTTPPVDDLTTTTTDENFTLETTTIEATTTTDETTEADHVQENSTNPTTTTESSTIQTTTVNNVVETTTGIVEEPTMLPQAGPVRHVRFPGEAHITTKPPHTLMDFVRFPEDHIATSEIQPHQHHTTRDTINHHFVSENQRHVTFTNRPVVESSTLEHSDGLRAGIGSDYVHNRRNRDKHLFLLPPRWDQSSLQKPLVLRVSRKHAYVDTQHFKQPDYYRALPPELFGFRQKHLSHRL